MFLLKLSRSPEKRSRLQYTQRLSDAPFEKFTFSKLYKHMHLRVKRGFFFFILNVVDGAEKLSVARAYDMAVRLG